MTDSTLSPTVQTARDRATAAERALAAPLNHLVETNWQLVATIVREAIPEATGIRTTGHLTEDGDLRLNLEAVLVDGEPISVDIAVFGQLQQDLDEPLMMIGDYDFGARDVWLSDEEDDDSFNDHDLPAAPAEPTELPSACRFYFPTVVVVGLKGGRVTHAEIGGVLGGLATEWIDDTNDDMQDPEECPPVLGQLAGDVIDLALSDAERDALHSGIAVYTDEPHPLAKPLTVLYG